MPARSISVSEGVPAAIVARSAAAICYGVRTASTGLILRMSFFVCGIAKTATSRLSQNAEWAAGFCWTEMGGRNPGAPTGLRFLTQRVHHRAGKGASWSTQSVLGGLRKSFVCLRAHSALKQTLDFETAPGTAGATTQGGEHCLPRQEPGWKRPHATLKLLPSPHCFRDSLQGAVFGGICVGRLLSRGWLHTVAPANSGARCPLCGPSFGPPPPPSASPGSSASPGRPTSPSPASTTPS